MIRYHVYDGGFWFRVLGFGLSVVDRSKHPPLFSERIGLVKVLRLGKSSVKLLTS